jgi:glycyl-tRNA synthetase beta chain
MGRDFLLEIGTEELPSSACHAVLELLPERVLSLFTAEDVLVEAAQVGVMVSPRRIAVMVSDVPEEQTPREVVQRGPAVEAAFDASGEPTPAALGFARAKGVTPADLVVRSEGGRSFVYFVSVSEARSTAELLPGICLKLVRDMYFPKNMRWGFKDLRFSRPMRWLVALYGTQVVPFGIAGVESGRASRGHRWLGAPVEIAEPALYVEAMRSVFVMVDQVERRAHIQRYIDEIAGARRLHAVDPMNKMAEVLYLVEWPTVLEGSFGEEHLRLPSEVLIMAMQSHQRYFPLVDDNDALSHVFLYVTNGDPACAASITAGNERVLEGRIEDAEFSFDKDLATGLEHMAHSLDRVVFHEKIGTMRDKTDRLVFLAHHLADALGLEGDVRLHLLEAAQLAKADQVSIMVREFADLEGVMGATYALMEGFHEEVGQAIGEQFLPDAAGGELPETIPGAILATVEKVDNIVAAFACGEPPTGSKDPYGLRRAAMGMVTIANRHDFDYDLRELVQAAYVRLESIPGLAPADEVTDSAVSFVKERVAKWLTDAGIARDTVEAVLPTSDTFLDLAERARALDEFRGLSAFEDLVTVYTRPANLAKKLPPEQGDAKVDPDLFVDDAERSLYEAAGAVGTQVQKLATERRYGEALTALATLRPAVDAYFDGVLVMAEEEAVRNNRLRQLALIRDAVRSLSCLDLLQG